VGKLADFVVLSDNPLSVDPETLAALKVVETIKEGASIYRA
jgi:predicted amidohydrolase YtcJ